MRTFLKPLAVCLHLLVVLMVQPVVADPVGPAVVATVDRTLWPEIINTQAGFDKASRAAQLIYVRNLHNMQSMTDGDMLAAFKINSVNRSSVDQWINAELSLTLNNYLQAAKSCVAADWTCIEKPATLSDFLLKADAWSVKIPTTVSAWRDNLDAFTHTYIAEQMRLAALFPKVTSEITTFNDNEWTGANLADREFYLTFDDGPTKAQSTTDETLAMLKEQKKSGAFFVLGANFQTRINASSVDSVKTVYGDQCVALHGWEHQSHAKWEQWQDSIVRSKTLVANTIAKQNVSSLFRPPYGQRKNDSGNFFKAQHLQVALWNIDSQDWNARVDANAVANRIIALMLIKRHGVILFHDIHPKAKIALPKIFDNMGDAVKWGDCHDLDKI
jgi:peptidoglycan/xylan/chitin deacetylase (PgdA/CDA1 family)